MKNNVMKFMGIIIACIMIILTIPNYAYADATDNNDTSSSATPISSAAALAGVISSDDDVDFYKYIVDVSGYYNFTLTDTGAQGKTWRLSVYDSSLNELESDTNSDYTLTTNTYNFEKGNVLYLKVEDSYKSIGKEYAITVNATAASDWEQEYTDTKEDATILKAGTSMHGNIYSGDDVDFYEYTVNVTGHYNFTLKDEKETGRCWRLEVYDSSLNELESDTNSNYTLTTDTYNFEKGTVLYLKVSDSYRTIGDEYSISVNETAASDWEQEENNTKGSATTIKSNSTIYGNLYSSDDVDYYEYKVDVTGYYNFTLKDTKTEGKNWRITIYDANLNELESNTNGEYTYTTNTYNFKKGTILYIKVTDSYRSVAKEYSLTVNAKKNTNWEQEGIDSFGKAIVLKANKIKYGNLYSSDDIDYYTYTAAKATTLKASFKFDADEVGNGWVITVYDSSKQEITSVSDITTDKTISFKVTKGKKYYIVVEPDSSYSCPTSITYALKIK